MRKRVWVLGPQSREMDAIEALLRDCGECIEYALVGGIRVGKAAAYNMSGRTAINVSMDQCITHAVECDGDYLLQLEQLGCSVHRVDYHCPGSAGYDRPPEEAVMASSLGQVIAILAEGRPLAPGRDDERVNILPVSWIYASLRRESSYTIPTPSGLAAIPHDLAVIAACSYAPNAAAAEKVPHVSYEDVAAYEEQLYLEELDQSRKPLS